MSRAVQVLLLGVLFLLVAVGCVAFLVVSGGVDPTGSRIIGAGGALLLLAALAAAVSALGPKYRPTPFLTPITAGVFTALLATSVVLAGHSQYTTKAKEPAARGVAERRIPPVPQTKGKAPQPAVQTAAVQQPAVQPAPAKPVRVLEASQDAAAAAASQTVAPAAAPVAQPAPMPPSALSLVPPPAEPAKPAPVEAKPPVAMPSTSLAAADVAAPAPPAKKPVAVAAVPSPKPAPALPAGSGAPTTLQTGFDTTTPAGKSAGQPLSLAAAASQPVQASQQSATPPLPRIRPCGAGGPACP